MKPFLTMKPIRIKKQRKIAINRISLSEISSNEPATIINGQKNIEIPKSKIANITIANPTRRFFKISTITPP
ncbi:MAG: hypothetical protein KAU58_01955 [Candidatus Omnitrophica bacterium]|nr:hypothetical protein [Candidatus Omnitrophota bacterium]